MPEWERSVVEFVCRTGLFPPALLDEKRKKLPLELPLPRDPPELALRLTSLTTQKAPRPRTLPTTNSFDENFGTRPAAVLWWLLLLIKEESILLFLSSSPIRQQLSGDADVDPPVFSRYTSRAVFKRTSTDADFMSFTTRWSDDDDVSVILLMKV
jgi:hypothetical protein